MVKFNGWLKKKQKKTCKKIYIENSFMLRLYIVLHFYSVGRRKWRVITHITYVLYCSILNN